MENDWNDSTSSKAKLLCLGETIHRLSMIVGQQEQYPLASNLGSPAPVPSRLNDRSGPRPRHTRGHLRQITLVCNNLNTYTKACSSKLTILQDVDQWHLSRPI